MTPVSRETTRDSARLRPLLRWIGGKQRLATKLAELVPLFVTEGHYREPFVGAASLFFRLQPKRSVLGDNNPELVNCYKCIRSDPKRVEGYLRRWRGQFCTELYLEARRRFNVEIDPYRRAALFLVLNRTCFNGIWRVSRVGHFNVPYGNKNEPWLPSLQELFRYARVLRTASLRCGDFDDQLDDCAKGDFVYLDPPYPPLNGTSYFTHYTQERFGSQDQERVALKAHVLWERGCRVMVSNVMSASTLRLYKAFRIEEISTTRYVGAGGVRHKVQDIVAMNYRPDGTFVIP